jgi:hypothetical protein
MVAFLWVPYATYSYLQLPCATYYCILAETTLFIYHGLVSLAGQITHPSIHSFIL